MCSEFAISIVIITLWANMLSSATQCTQCGPAMQPERRGMINYASVQRVIPPCFEPIKSYASERTSMMRRKKRKNEEEKEKFIFLLIYCERCGGNDVCRETFHLCAPPFLVHHQFRLVLGALFSWWPMRPKEFPAFETMLHLSLFKNLFLFSF